MSVIYNGLKDDFMIFVPNHGNYPVEYVCVYADSHGREVVLKVKVGKWSELILYNRGGGESVIWYFVKGPVNQTIAKALLEGIQTWYDKYLEKKTQEEKYPCAQPMTDEF